MYKWHNHRFLSPTFIMISNPPTLSKLQILCNAACCHEPVQGFRATDFDEGVARPPPPQHPGDRSRVWCLAHQLPIAWATGLRSLWGGPRPQLPAVRQEPAGSHHSTRTCQPGGRHQGIGSSTLAYLILVSRLVLVAAWTPWLWPQLGSSQVLHASVTCVHHGPQVRVPNIANRYPKAGDP
jgi:hypothetical protein